MIHVREVVWTVLESARPPKEPPGIVLPSGRFLYYTPHKACPCIDCVEAFEALPKGELRSPRGDLPW